MNDSKIRIFDICNFRNEDGPGIRTIVFFKGCPLRCKWCSNPFGLDPSPQIVFNRRKCIGCRSCINVCHAKAIKASGERVLQNFQQCISCGNCVSVCPAKARRIAGESCSIQEVYEEIQKDRMFYRRSGGGITLSGGEVLMQYNGAARLLKLCRENLFLNTAIETSAFGSWEHLKLLADKCDTIYVDLKHIDERKHMHYIGAPLHPILKNIENLCNLSASEKNLKIIVRRPIIPGINDDEETSRRTGEYISQLNGSPKVELLPFHTYGEAKYEMIGLNNEMADTQMLTNKNPVMLHVKEVMHKYAPETEICIGGA